MACLFLTFVLRPPFLCLPRLSICRSVCSPLYLTAPPPFFAVERMVCVPSSHSTPHCENRLKNKGCPSLEGGPLSSSCMLPSLLTAVLPLGSVVLPPRRSLSPHFFWYSVTENTKVKQTVKGIKILDSLFSLAPQFKQPTQAIRIQPPSQVKPSQTLSLSPFSRQSSTLFHR